MISFIKSHWQRLLFFATLFTLALFILGQPGATAVLANAAISGTVFRDFDNDGSQDANEPGIANITVTAVSDTGDVQSVQTGNDGSYLLPAVGQVLGNSARVEFTLPGDGSLDFLAPSAAGGTTVQFIDISGGGTVSNVDAGFYNPAQYNLPTNPDVVTTRFEPGDNASTTGQSVIRGHSYNDNGASVALTAYADADEVGTIYGLAYQASSGILFGSSYVRRGAGLGPDDTTGTIYQLTGTGAPALFTDLTATVGTGANPHPNDPAGTDWIADSATFPLVGKTGLGDLEISDDGLMLYTVNLEEKELVIIPLALDGTIDGAISTVTIDPPTTCDGDPGEPTAADWRPFGLKYFDGKLYVGGVCTAQSMVDVLDPNTATFATDIVPILPFVDAHVYEYDPVATTFTNILTVDMDYAREPVNDGAYPSTANDGEWLPWADFWHPNWMANRSGDYYLMPQPLLTDIEFDGHGFMMLGFRDRFSDQAYHTADPGPAGAPTSNHRFGGDILLACQTAGGGWQLESGSPRSCTNGLTGVTRTASNPPSDDANYTEDEFFHADQYLPGGTPPAQYHDETAMGALAMLYGSGEIMATKYDVFATQEAGTIVYDTANGDRNRAVEIYAPNSGFGKAGGIGDVEVLAGPPPIEIGNRVWVDLDGDGVQDPDAGEGGISGVTVNLYRDNGDGTYTLVGTSVTDANGQFLFNDTNVNQNGASGLEYNTTYVIRIDDTSTVGQTNLSPPNQGSNDLHDTDGSMLDTMGTGTPNPEIVYSTGGPGENDHTLDFGFNSTPTAVTLTELNVVAPTPLTIVVATMLLLLLLVSGVIMNRQIRRQEK